VAEWWSSAESAGAHYSVGAWLFLRAIGLIYTIAFASLALQIGGLAGREGILPAREFLAEVRRQFGRSRFMAVPTLCWLNDSDRFLRFLCWGGAAAGVLALTGVATLPALMVCWVFYLSLFGVARLFLGYQWDVLLVEAGLLAILLAPLQLLPTGPVDAPPWPILILLYWLCSGSCFFRASRNYAVGMLPGDASRPLGTTTRLSHCLRRRRGRRISFLHRFTSCRPW